MCGLFSSHCYMPPISLGLGGRPAVSLIWDWDVCRSMSFHDWPRWRRARRLSCMHHICYAGLATRDRRSQRSGGGRPSKCGGQTAECPSAKEVRLSDLFWRGNVMIINFVWNATRRAGAGDRGRCWFSIGTFPPYSKCDCPSFPLCIYLLRIEVLDYERERESASNFDHLVLHGSTFHQHPVPHSMPMIGVYGDALIHFKTGVSQSR